MDVNYIITFFTSYGYHLGLLAISGIFLLGFLKLTGIFKKVPTDKKKHLYFTISCIISIIACTIYLLVAHQFTWVDYGTLCGSVIALTMVTYNLYECLGFRAIWQQILKLLGKLIMFIIEKIVNKTLTAETLKEKAIELGSATLVELSRKARENEIKAQQSVHK